MAPKRQLITLTNDDLNDVMRHYQAKMRSAQIDSMLLI